MPKATGLPALNLSAANNIDNVRGLSPATLSPRSEHAPRSPRSAPASPNIDRPQQSIMQVTTMQNLDTRDPYRNGPTSPRITAVPEFPPSSNKSSPRQHGREPSKNFFSNLMASKSSHKLNSTENVNEFPEKQNARSRASSKDRSLHSLRRQGSTPELPKNTMNGSMPLRPAQNPPNSASLTEAAQPAAGKQKGKSRFGLGLTRTKTLRTEENNRQRAQPPAQLNLDTHPGHENVEPPLKTAPVKSDHRARAFAAENESAPRNRSADRHVQEEPIPQRKNLQQGGNMPVSHSMQLLSNISQTGKGVGDRLGKAGKGLFGRITRSGSSNEREGVTDDTYMLQIIHLPLIKQTRKTRIARRLEASRDKTEFWMPALPWRCIDYLNMNGCEEEGLYRIPGSGKDVKHWQRRFDTEYDINLFEEPDLHDINTIGSMFKAWLRDLPDEILPKSVQNKVAQQCSGATRTPQLLKDELSKLPPFNYYLLFAITCHLSLLTSFADKNRMDYRNLCICFQPCLKIDAFCFQFLVMDWKNCWQGCWTEKEYLEEEYRYEREGSVGESDEQGVDERAVSSSGSSQNQNHQQHSAHPQTTHQQPHHPREPHQPSQHAKEQQREGREVHHALPKTSDGTTRKPAAPRTTKQRSQSTSETRKSSGNSSHHAAQSVPMVPRITTPEPLQIKAPEELPEVGSLSPIRM